ncbi:hypothetical protein DM01DRAFT_1349790 [Hesseltinella vesiculosa]|uniref:Zn(2)-C6 fungal-type domain-containing protein n=1 Tax=Hesseltinella vesiculosa TaxID=101127 RepID=A0A1X2G3R5_9FUNG|nr:hypothetical protein DM01DRAFT_1349790 [Hesseltinella vesiculosa]
MMDHNTEVQPHVHPLPYEHAQMIHEVSAIKRKQVKNACTNCQKACKKCADERPCPRCVKYNLADSCVNSVRKERKKGIKRGPYKRRVRSQGDEGATDEGNSTQGSSAPVAANVAYGNISPFPAYPAHLNQYQSAYDYQAMGGQKHMAGMPAPQYYQTFPYPQQAMMPPTGANDPTGDQQGNESAKPKTKKAKKAKAKQPITPGPSSSNSTSASPDKGEESNMTKLAQLVTAALDNENTMNNSKSE